MALIPEFNAGTGQLHPSDMGPEAFMMEGRHIRAEYTAAGQELGSAVRQVGGQLGEAIDAHEAQMEISHGAAALAQMNDGLVQGWNAAAKNADPNDTSISQQFRDTVLEPGLENWAGQFQTKAGQAWAQNQAMQVRQHMYEKQAADMSYRAGLAATTNLEQTANSLANTARTDPSHLDQSLGLVDNTVSALVDNMPNLSADNAAKMKTQLAQAYKTKITTAAIRGMAESNPEATLTALTSGKYAEYLDPSDQQTLTTYAHQQIKAKEQDAKHAQVDADRQADLASDTQRNGYMQRLVVGKDGGYQIPPGFAKAVMMDPKLNTSDRSSLMALSQRYADVGAEQKAAHPKEDDPATYQRYAQIMGSPDQTPDPREVMKDYSEGKLTTSTFKKLTDAAYDQDPATGANKYDRSLVSAGIARASAQISGGNVGFMSPAETAASKKFALDIRQQLATGDAKDLLNPKSPNYVFSPEHIQAYVPPKGANAQSILNPGATPPPAGPNWIQRMFSGTSQSGAPPVTNPPKPAARKPLDEIFGGQAPKMTPEQFEAARKAGNAT